MDDTKQILRQIILQAVCDVFALHEFALMSNSRKREIADARHIASNCLQEYGFHPTEAAAEAGIQAACKYLIEKGGEA